MVRRLVHTEEFFRWIDAAKGLTTRELQLLFDGVVLDAISVARESH